MDYIQWKIARHKIKWERKWGNSERSSKTPLGNYKSLHGKSFLACW